MKYRKFNKYEKKEVQLEQMANALHGEGLYLFQNNTNADLALPRPTKSGLRSVGPRQQFQGDNYYMQLVKGGFLRLIKEIQSPAQQKAANEAPVQEKLILDQPDTVTHQGKVEHVVAKPAPAQKLNENKGGQQTQPDVLLNEGPVDDGFVIVQ
jgi:hypothetical protein